MNEGTDMSITLAQVRPARAALDQRTADNLVCTCGQALDCCTREHCPRCGRALSSAEAPVLAAFPAP